MSGTLPTVFDLPPLTLFQDDLIYQGAKEMYRDVKDILLEANAIYIANHFYEERDKERQILLHFAVGFMRNWQKEQEKLSGKHS